jgi:uncharacterized protein YukE
VGGGGKEPGTPPPAEPRREGETAMTELVVDSELMRHTAINIRVVRGELSNATNYVAAIHDAIGHERLAQRVEEFTDGWRVHRERLVEALTKLDEVADEVADAFQEVDATLAKDLKGETT